MKRFNENYQTVYSFQVIPLIQAGRSVYILDRLMAAVYKVSDLKVYELAEMLRRSEETPGRYHIWIASIEEIETEETE